MSMIRWRTLSPASFFLFSSFLFSGSRWPGAHCASPRPRRGAFAAFAGVAAGLFAGVVRVAVAPVWGDTAASSLTFFVVRCFGRARATGRPPPLALSCCCKKKGRPGRSAVRARLASLGYKVSCNTELNVGRQSAVGTTNGATDALQVDVPTHDEHGVRNIHLNRITHFVPVCPAEVAHVAANPAPGPAIPASAIYGCKDLPVLR